MTTKQQNSYEPEYNSEGDRNHKKKDSNNLNIGISIIIGIVLLAIIIPIAIYIGFFGVIIIVGTIGMCLKEVFK